MASFVDLTGLRFERLVVKGRAESRNRRTYWVCECDCGNSVEVESSNLRSGRTRSCGCLSSEMMRGNSRKKTHGMTKTRLYSEYRHMHNRCKPDADCRRNYYDKGVRVCKEWQRFEPFMEWALNESGYRDDLTLDRIDSSGNYEPSNCRWATTRQQGNNKSTCVYVTINGEKKSMKEWSEIFGISYNTVQERRKRGYPEDKWFAPPFSYRVKKHG